MFEPRINQNKCMMCEMCVDECSVFIISSEDAIEINEDEFCCDCGECERICPAGAIEVLEV